MVNEGKSINWDVIVRDSDRGRIQRVQLPGGEWWDFVVPTKYKHQKAYAAFIREHADDPDLIDYALIYLTHAWSFDAPVSVESLGELSIQDTNAANQFFNDQILSLVNPLAQNSSS